MVDAKIPEQNVETPKEKEKKEEGHVESEVKQEPKQEEENTDEWKSRFEKIAQSAADKVRFEYSKKLKDAQKEIELLKTEKMSEGERREFEAQKLKEALEDKERDLTRRENELLAMKTLDEKKLPATFLDFVIGNTEEETQKKIDKLEKTFLEELKLAVDTRMKAHGLTPRKGQSTDTTSFEGLSPQEIQKKAREDPEWFRKNETSILEFYKNGYKK